VAADPRGDVYVLAAGRLRAGQRGQGVYLFVSRDAGRHFSRPIKVNRGVPQAAQLPWIAAGKGPGEALIGWYGSTASPDANSDKGRWRYNVAETLGCRGPDAGSRSSAAIPMTASIPGPSRRPPTRALRTAARA
jgi:hypothetical protein